MDLFGPHSSPLQRFLETDNLSYLYEYSTFDWLILILYFSVLSILAVYGLHRYYLVYLHFKYRDKEARPAGRLEILPKITVQLPIFNEMYVVERLIDHVCRFDYPRDLLEIQVLDDSTDETQRLAQRKVREYAEQGFDIHYIRRPERVGYKAGALDHGLKTATGELIAIFDADFTPRPDTLLNLVDYFSDPKVGMVQIRWEHINRDYSLLTNVQSIMLDGHFILESATRYRSGRFFNFNGTAGIWRRAAIEDAGGWEHDTLTEDLDLSYRAQMKGWKFVFVPHLTAPAEIPVDVNAFKSQQYRWAKGSIQTCKKILPRLLFSDLPLPVKAEGFFHLTANIAYPLMVVLGLMLLPALIVRFHQGWFELLLLDLPLFMAATFSVSSFYIVSQKEIYVDWRSRLWYLPFLMSVGIGLSINNSKAVIEAFLGKESSFVRTPKFSVRNSGDNWTEKKYRLPSGMAPFIEIAFGIYFSLMIMYALDGGLYATVPFLMLFMVGYFYTGFLSLFQRRFCLSRPVPVYR
ncbi:MAG TPA: glycosyltransferase family 2 protein [Acidobacteriota bacterium]|nr:glycosyltransferase family 2 protein [Acidobacteriota bacterium]